MSRTVVLVPHLIAVIAFFMTHGTSAGLAFAARRERDPARLRRLLDLCFRSLTLLYVWAVMLVVFGVIGGFRGRSRGSLIPLDPTSWRPSDPWRSLPS